MSDLFETNYNYVFYNLNDDYMEPALFSLNSLPMVRAYKLAFEASSLVNKVFFYHWSNKLNSKLKIPFKKIWFKKMFDISFSDEKPICYVFYMAKYIDDDVSIYNYIKSLNPSNKCVIFFGDLVSKRNYDIEKLKKHTDLIVSYDEGEAIKYGFSYNAYSLGYKNIIDVVEPSSFEYDVYFVGFAKDRLKQIHNTYNYLTENGLKCKFIVCGTKPEDRIQADGILYQKPISYRENLYNINSSKCILDIIQENSKGLTMRVEEAIAFKRKLLTNNIFLSEQRCYNDKTMHCYKNICDIDIDFLKSKIDYNLFSSESITSADFIKEFESLLSGV